MNRAVMQEVRCEVVRWIADEPQPGWVEACFTDANGRRRSFFDKPPVFGALIRRSSILPIAGAIRCEVVASRNDERGRKILEIRLLDGVESDEGSVKFEVRAGQVMTSAEE